MSLFAFFDEFGMSSVMGKNTDRASQTSGEPVGASDDGACWLNRTSGEPRITVRRHVCLSRTISCTSKLNEQAY